MSSKLWGIVILAGIGACSSSDPETGEVPGPGPAPDAAEAPAPVESCSGEEVTYQIRNMTVPVDENPDQTIGFNLDGFISDGDDGTGCGIEDTVGFDGTQGVDNQLERVLAQFNLDVDITAELNEKLADGTVAARLVIGGIDSYENDDCVDIKVLFSGNEIATETVFEARGAIENGALLTETGVFAGTLPLAGPVEVHLDPTIIGADITEVTVEGVIGAAIPIETIVEVMASNNPQQAALIQLILENNADMDGREQCTALSAALAFVGDR